MKTLPLATLSLLAFLMIAVISPNSASAQHGSCSSYGGIESLCNADEDCHFCPILGVYGCQEIDNPCMECADLEDQASCDNEAIYGCYWCGTKQRTC